MDASAGSAPTLRLRTKFAFAVVTMLGGAVLGTTTNADYLPLLLAFFTVLGFVGVDWLGWFSLPGPVAYAAMSAAAIYSVIQFVWPADESGQQMIVVAELLVMAQSILMLQSKTIRILEQLIIFALLNCTVAAVFNDALNYAIVFIPLALLGGFALILLATENTVERLSYSTSETSVWLRAWDLAWRHPERKHELADTHADEAIDSCRRLGLRSSTSAATILFPTVILIATWYFFIVPRTIESARGVSGSTTAVGFSDQLRLRQIGRMLQNNALAMRVAFSHPETGKPYAVYGEVYFRGRVFERYIDTGSETSRTVGSWEAVHTNNRHQFMPLPMRFVPRRSVDGYFYDRVNVSVNCEPMQSPTLFAIAPYHRIPGSEILTHQSGRWTVSQSRSSKSRAWQQNAIGLDPWMQFPRTNYSFGTHAFRNGIQSRWLVHEPVAKLQDHWWASGPVTEDSPEAEQHYLNELLAYQTELIPSAEKIASEIVAGLPPQKRDAVTIAESLQLHLATSDRYAYSMDLSAPVDPDVDPIEHFLSVHGRGHCQYFASALTMMLRSQGIAARMVVGFRSSEFNDLGQYLVVRQNHAHAWVEALVPAEDVPLREGVYGQPRSDRYWLRLDPTPGHRVETSPTGTEQLLDLAKNFWSDYVIDLDTNRQSQAMLKTPALSPMTMAYREWINRAEKLAVKVNAGRIEGIKPGEYFSWRGLVGSVGIGLILVLLLRSRLWVAWTSLRAKPGTQSAPRPSLAFYAETMDLMERIGCVRRPGQTPLEFLNHFSDTQTMSEALQQPLNRLTAAFYRLRYGRAADSDQNPYPESRDGEIDEALEAVRLWTVANHRKSNGNSS